MILISETQELGNISIKILESREHFDEVGDWDSIDIKEKRRWYLRCRYQLPASLSSCERLQLQQSDAIRFITKDGPKDDTRK